MWQTILVGIIFLAAILYLIRFIIRQIKTGKDENIHCDKCLPGHSTDKPNSKR